MQINKLKSGHSLLNENLNAEAIFTPEEFTDEHRMIADLAEKFVLNEVVPSLEDIEKGQFELSVQLLKAAGELGLLGIDISDEFGGLQLDKVSSTLITEKMAVGRSFSVTYSGQVGIGSLPIVYFGTQHQKETYLPGIVTGEKIGAYALTEPTSGTDALSAKTTAKLSECGQFYILNGEKQFITNSAFADIFIVFAKIDGEKFTTFIVDKDSEGLSTGPEEKKMGLKGSSTRSLILDNVKVPIENVLGEIGKGHVIAFNILNVGRHKISASCLGNSKQAIELAVTYAKERKQFGKPLADFSLIKQKLADMAIKTYVNESMIYRTAGLLDQQLEGVKDDGHEIGKAIGQYATECSINKVFSSEALDFIIDEAVQIHGGYGYISEYEVETLYRDSRINRIFEGTNEINRILIATNLLKKYQQASDQSTSFEWPNGTDALYMEKVQLRLAKEILKEVVTCTQEVERLQDEQELLAAISDTAIDIYGMESAVLRTEKASDKNGIENEQQKVSYTKTFVQDTMLKMVSRFNHILSYLDSEKFEKLFIHNRNLILENSNVNMIELKRKIADKIIEKEKYTS